MRLLMIVGLVLITLGVIGLVYGGITYTKDEEHADFGFFEVTFTEKERLQIHPVLGGIVLAAGLIVFWAGWRKRNRPM